MCGGSGPFYARDPSSVWDEHGQRMLSLVCPVVLTVCIKTGTRRIIPSSAYAPINSKLQHPPPPAYPGHLTVHRALGGGNLNVALEGWGI